MGTSLGQLGFLNFELLSVLLHICFIPLERA